MRFQQHPDRLIIIFDGTINYIDTIENFRLDYLLATDVILPEGERYYQPGTRHFTSAGVQPLEWPVGDAAIAALPDIYANKTARETPPLPSVTEQQQYLIGLSETLFYQLASIVTAEPTITPTKLISWQEKYGIAVKWQENGKPDPELYPVTYAKALTEAANRVDELAEPAVLLEYWLTNGQQWNYLKDRYYLEFEPVKRAQIRAAATLDALAGIEAGLENDLRQFLLEA